jgi:hypothetical protein
MTNNTASNEEFNENNQNKVEQEYQLEMNEELIHSLTEQHLVLGKALESLKKMTTDNRKMHENMKKISQKTEETHQKTEITYAKVLELDKKLDDRVLLSDAEISELYDVVSDISIQIASKMNWQKKYPNADNFGKVCGWIRRTLWSIVNRRFGVSSYKKIKFIQYNDALEFVSNLSAADYYNRVGYKK